MKSPRFKITNLVLAAATLTMAAGVQAQSNSNSMMGSMYAPGSSYIGLNAGRSDFKLGGGTGGFPSDNKDNAYSIYAGSYFNPNFGLELGYIDFGRISRGGGTTRAEGVNLSLVGRLPLNQAFSLTGRVGGTYSRSDISSAFGSNIARGKESGFGVSYGVGAEYAFNTNWSAVAQYDVHDVKFVNTNENVNTMSFGLKYRF